MKYISRLTALLLALLMLISSAGAEMSIDDLTMGELDALYTSTDEDTYINWDGGVLDDWFELAAFSNVSDKTGYTFQWYDQDGNAVTGLSEDEPYKMIVHYTLTEQRFYCLATDGNGNTFKSEVNVIAPAQTTDMDAYLTYLYGDAFYDEEGNRNHHETYRVMHETWNVAVDGGNLAHLVADAWQAESSTDYYDHELLCSCVLTGAVSADFCVLAPDAEHAPSCGWYHGSPVLELTAETDAAGNVVRYILSVEEDGEVRIIAETEMLDGVYHYFKDVSSGLFVAWLRIDADGSMWIVPLESENQNTPAN